jgi:hypothetical protein
MGLQSPRIGEFSNHPASSPTSTSPCPALPCLALPCIALPCLALPCPALPCPALPCLALPCRASLLQVLTTRFLPIFLSLLLPLLVLTMALQRPRALQLLRLYTTEKQLGGDRVMRAYFLTSIMMNGTMAGQIMYYGNRQAARSSLLAA